MIEIIEDVKQGDERYVHLRDSTGAHIWKFISLRHLYWECEGGFKDMEDFIKHVPKIEDKLYIDPPIKIKRKKILPDKLFEI
jgi:hypothetical protein